MRIPTLGVVAALACLIMPLAVAPAAQADTFCVNRSGCAPGHDFTTIQQAIAAADANDPLFPALPTRDRILVGDGVFHEAVDNGSDNPIDIVGAGPRTATGGTRIERDPGSSVRTVSMGASFGSIAASTISDVTIAVASGSGNTGLQTAGAAENVVVTADAPLTNGVGVSGQGNGPLTTLRRIDVDLPGTAVGMQLRLATVEDSSIKASTGVNLQGVVLRRSTIDANVGVTEGELEDCVIRISGPNGIALRSTGIGVNVFNRIEARHVTIVGDSDPTSLAVRANAEGNASSDNSADVDVRSSIIRGFARNFQRSGNMAGGHTGTANIAIAYSNYDSSIPAEDNGGPGSLDETTPGGNTSADPRFLSGTDLRLAYDSPLIDAGDPDSPDTSDFPPESTLDLGGFARKVDGDGDGAARADVGAYELQQAPPEITAATVTPTRVLTGRPVSFRGVGTDANGEPLTFRWDFGDGRSAAGANATHRYSTAGTKTATLTVTDFRGLRASVTRSIAVNARPKLTSLRVRRRIRADRSLPRPTRKRRTATIRFRLSEDAAVRLSFARRLPGGRVRRVPASVRIKGRKGLNRVRFHGRLSKRSSLEPGSYRLTIVARDRDGARSGPKRARLRLLSPIDSSERN